MAKESILDLLTEDRFAALETVYSERERVIPWQGWRTGLIMYLSALEAAAIARPTNNAGKDTMEAALVKASFGNQRSLAISLTHGARVGLLFGDDCRLVSRAGQVRYHVTPDGKSRLCHQAGISLSSAEIYDVDFTAPGRFEINLGDEGPIIHHPNLPARFSGECCIIAAWAQGVWFENGVERRAKAVADKARLDIGANHGDPGIWKEHPGKMARNTAISDLWRYLPRTADMDAVTQAAEEEDEQPVRKSAERASPMNLPDAGTLGAAQVQDRDGLVVAPEPEPVIEATMSVDPEPVAYAFSDYDREQREAKVVALLNERVVEGDIPASIGKVPKLTDAKLEDWYSRLINSPMKE